MHVQEGHSLDICRTERASEIIQTYPLHTQGKQGPERVRLMVPLCTVGWWLVKQDQRRMGLPLPGSPLAPRAAKAGQRGIYLPGSSLILVLVPGRAAGSLSTRWIPGP